MDTLAMSQAHIFFIFILNGILISFIFDIFRILRKAFKTPDFVTYVEDILFWIIACIILAYSIYKFNNGAIRLYMFIGVFIGFILYILTISKYIVKISVKFMLLAKNIIIKIFHCIIFPVKRMAKLLKNIFIKLIFSPFLHFIKKLLDFFKKFSKKSLKPAKIRRI